jgi:arylformamidase
MTTDANRTATQPLTPEQRTALKRERTEAVRAQYQHDLGIRYGEHPRQVLDIYRPKQTGPAPVFVFIHGGGFQRGEPSAEGYLGGPMLGRGALYVSLGYRLAPEARYPHSADDVERGLRWIYDHIAEYGGDPNRIYLAGTSAGATLAAAVALRNWVAEPGLPNDLIKGLVLFSGPYDQSISNNETYDETAPRFVPNLTEAIERTPPQTIVVSTDNDMPWAPANADAMTAALRARGAPVEQILQRDADHFTAPRSLADGEGEVFEAVCRMLRRP